MLLRTQIKFTCRTVDDLLMCQAGMHVGGAPMRNLGVVLSLLGD